MSEVAAGERGAERDRRARLGFLLANAYRVVRLGLGLMSVPLAITYFEREQYGFWLVGLSVVAYLSLSHFGVGNSLLNTVARQRGAAGPDDQKRAVSSAFFPFLVAALVIGVVGFILVRILPIDRLFGLSSKVREAPAVLTVLMAWALIDLVLRIPLAAQQGHQEDYRAHAWNIVGAIAAFSGLVAVTRLDGGLLGWAYVSLVANMGVEAINLVLFLREHPECRPSLRFFDWGEAKLLFTRGFLFWCLQICSLLIVSTDNVVIARLMGATEVATYGVVFQLVMFGTTVIHALSASHWGAYAEAAGRGDWDWIGRSFSHIIQLSVWLAAAAGLCVAAWGQDLLRVWLRGEITASATLLAVMGAYLAINVWYNAYSVLLGALDRVGRQVIAFGLEAAVHLTLSLILVTKMGIEGAAWATIVPAVAITAWLLPVLARRALGGHAPRVLFNLLRGVAIPAALALGATVLLRRWLGESAPLIRLLVGSAGTLAVFGVSSLVLMGRERAMLALRKIT